MIGGGDRDGDGLWRRHVDATEGGAAGILGRERESRGTEGLGSRGERKCAVGGNRGLDGEE